MGRWDMSRMRGSPQHLPMSMSLRILYQRVFRLLLRVIPAAAEPVKAGVVIVIVSSGTEPGSTGLLRVYCGE
jgi:hypothetical protein